MAPLLAAARSSRPRALAVIALAVALIAVLVVASARAAVSASPLPDVSAEDLVASVLETGEDPPPISGEIAASLELGLPDVSAFGPPEAGQDGLAALAGDQRLRLWRSPTALRVAQLGDTSSALHHRRRGPPGCGNSSDAARPARRRAGRMTADEPPRASTRRSTTRPPIARQALELARRRDRDQRGPGRPGRRPATTTACSSRRPAEETLIGRVGDRHRRRGARGPAQRGVRPGRGGRRPRGWLPSVSFAPIDPPPSPSPRRRAPRSPNSATTRPPRPRTVPTRTPTRRPMTSAAGAEGRASGSRASHLGPDVRTSVRAGPPWWPYPAPRAAAETAQTGAEGEGGVAADLEALAALQRPAVSVQAAEVDGESWCCSARSGATSRPGWAADL